MTIVDTQHRLKALVQKRFGSCPNQDDSFAAIGIDSLSMAEFSLAIEKEFDIRLDEGVLDLDTVTDLVAYVDNLVAKKVLTKKAM